MKDLISQYSVQKKIIEKKAEDLKFNQKVLTGLKDMIKEEMEKQGVRRVVNEEVGMEVRMNVKKGYKVTNRARVLMGLQREGIDKSAYMDVSMSKVNPLVKKMADGGNVLDGVEKTESRYLSISELKSK